MDESDDINKPREPKSEEVETRRSERLQTTIVMLASFTGALISIGVVFWEGKSRFLYAISLTVAASATSLIAYIAIRSKKK